MRALEITKADYDDIIYPFVAVDQPETTAELRLSVRVLTKLEAEGTQDPQPTQPPPGQPFPPPALYRMNKLKATFRFEEDECKYLLKRMNVAIQNVQTRRTRTLLPLLSILEAQDPPQDTHPHQE